MDIRVECVTSEGLSGKKRDFVSWYFSFDWHSWGESVGEEIAKRQKAASTALTGLLLICAAFATPRGIASLRLDTPSTSHGAYVSRWVA